MKKLISLSLSLSILAAGASAAQITTHIRVDAPNAPELAATFESQGFDVVEGSIKASSVELVASDETMELLTRRGFEYEVLAVGRPFYEIQADRDAQYMIDTGEDMPPAGYSDLSGIVASMQAAETSFPSIVEFHVLNTDYGLPLTVGGRNLTALKISDNVGSDEDEPAMLILTAMHCREIVTPVISLEIVDQLTSGYGVDPSITALVDNYEIWVVPVANPDGYAYVFSTNNNWRKNRRIFGGGVGVDLNRNYDFGWSSGCAGSTNVSSETYKGPSAGSEVETMVIKALSNDKQFAKVLDMHSSGRETLWEYACLTYPFVGFQESEAIKISMAASYGTNNRPPSANGEHYEWQLARFGSYSFLIETALTFQPSFASAQAEAAQLWPAARFILERPIPLSGHITDACTGDPVVANLTYQVAFNNGEEVKSEGDFGRYHLFLPPSSHTITVSAPGYQSQSVPVTLVANTSQVLDFQLDPVVGAASSVTRNGSGANSGCYTTISPPVLGGNWVSQVDHSGHPGASFTVVFVYRNASSGTFLSGGELLVNTGMPRLFQSLKPASGSSNTHTTAIPSDPCLGNLFTASQAAILGGAGWEFCNAEDLISGL